MERLVVCRSYLLVPLSPCMSNSGFPEGHMGHVRLAVMAALKINVIRTRTAPLVRQELKRHT